MRFFVSSLWDEGGDKVPAQCFDRTDGRVHLCLGDGWASLFVFMFKVDRTLLMSY